MAPSKATRRQGVGNVGRADRTLDVAGLLPSLPTPDHPAQQDTVLAVGEPRADRGTQRVRESTVGDAQDSARRLPAIDHTAVAEAERAKAAGAPIHSDHA